VRDVAIDRGVDQVGSAHDVGLDRFERVVLGGRHLFERGGMHHDLHPVEGAIQAVLVSHIADEEAEVRIAVDRKVLPHLELFELVPAVDGQASRAMLRQDSGDELSTERARAAGQQNGRAVKTHAHALAPLVSI